MGATGSISKMDFSAKIYNISNSVIIGSNSIKSVEFKLNNVSNIRYAGMLNIGFYDYNNINLISLLNSFYT
ncbi:MAG TPA: hypothetical protein P5301_00235 [Bacteroidales bacterium]|jgi:hypothetical protein|nr:hypothetical protein [Bacteroidales bacterium]HQL11521.1 hypothetical protein [bacterium]HRR51888.1 hypothetical protein [Bacteroidales bacterium]